MSEDVFVLDAVRTPIGRHGGALAGVRPDDLAAGVISELLKRSPALDPAEVGDVVFGDGNGAGEDNRNVARMALLLAGVPPTVPGTLGCSGARILGSLAHELRRRGGGLGLAAICIGVGQGLAVVLES